MTDSTDHLTTAAAKATTYAANLLACAMPAAISQLRRAMSESASVTECGRAELKLAVKLTMTAQKDGHIWIEGQADYQAARPKEVERGETLHLDPNQLELWGEEE